MLRGDARTFWDRRRRGLPGSVLALAAAAGSLAAATPEAAFLRANTSVMNRMMTGMDAKPSGSIDADFVNMMEPHHQGAIEMAELELRFGHNNQLRRIAQEIIVDQQQEIAAMRLALGRPLPPPGAAPTQGSAHPSPTAGAATDMRAPHAAASQEP